MSGHLRSAEFLLIKSKIPVAQVKVVCMDVAEVLLETVSNKTWLSDLSF